jgi:alanine dehydrogenase
MYISTIAFPRMHKEREEKRDFLPSLFGKIERITDKKIFVEEGYGKDMGFTRQDYLKENPNITFLNSLDELYSKDLVIVVRSPGESTISGMRKGTVLFSMLHYEARPVRNRVIKEAGIFPFSMDGIIDDEGKRLFVYYEGTSNPAVKVTFEELKKHCPYFNSSDRRPLNATIAGCGPVGQTAIRALQKTSDAEFLPRDLPGMTVTVLSRAVLGDNKALKNILSSTDILVDATKRKDCSKYVIPNSMLGHLPEHSVILDITADPYDPEADPPTVKGFEGIPYGTLKKYVIEKDDPLYDEIPSFVNTTNRRLCVSCNAWPSFEPEKCMKIYEDQLIPFLTILLEKGPDNISETSVYPFERALARSTLDWYRKNCK